MTTGPEAAPDQDDQLLSLGPHRTVEQAVVAKLREAIITGVLRPGERLAYRDLARRFGVSVTPVRIALRELSNEGLVEMRAHAGARVSPLSLDELEEIFATRIGIEGWLALHGTERLTDEGIERMADLLDELTQAAQVDDREAYLRLSWALRSTCYEAAGRPRLLERLATLYGYSTRYHFLTIAEGQRFERSRQYMEEFFAACRARDGVAAQRTIQEAIAWTLSYLSAAVTNAEQTPEA